jgi:hypothetical protein
VHLFARVQRPLNRGARTLRTSIPERDEDVARVDQALVARGRPAGVGQFVEAGRHHLTAIPFARAALVAAASTPLALPVMMDALGGKELT